MLRVTSEMAVAIRVSSLDEKCSTEAISRPRSRAVTRSASERMGTVSSSVTAGVPQFEIEQRQAILEVEGGIDALEGQAQLHHGKGDIRLDPDDHRARPDQPRHLGDIADGAGGEGVEHVEDGDVD